MYLRDPPNVELLCDPDSFCQSVNFLTGQLYTRADHLLSHKLQVVSAAVISRQREVSRWEKHMLAQAKEQLYH